MAELGGQAPGFGIEGSQTPRLTLADLNLDNTQLVWLAQKLGYAGIPGMGNFQNDTVAVNDSVSPGYPVFVDFVFPGNLSKLQVVKFSFKVRAFRSYVNTSITGNTGAGTAHGHSNGSTGGDATGESGHSHNHGHNIPVGFGAGGNGNVTISNTGAAFLNATAGGGVPTDNTSTASSGHSHSHSHAGGSIGNESSHTHPTIGVITFQIQESTLPANIRISVDGSPTDGSAGDLTGPLGGPWNADVVELDLTKYLIASTGVYHTIQLTSSVLGRIMAFLRVTSVVNPFGGA